MARIRSIHPSLCKSRTFATLSADLERTFLRLLTYCDDEGRGDADPRLVKCELYPLHDEMTADRVAADLSGLATVGLLELYAIDDRQYLQMTAWSAYQKPQKPRPSTIPDPITGTVTEPSGNGTVPLPYGSAAGGERELGDGEGEGGGTGEDDPSPNGNGTHPKRRKSQIPEDFTPDADLLAWATKNHPTVNVRSETVKFIDYHKARGTTMLDWRAAWRTWIRNAEMYATNGNGKRNGHADLVDDGCGNLVRRAQS